jgi:hypothetical protein
MDLMYFDREDDVFDVSSGERCRGKKGKTRDDKQLASSRRFSLSRQMTSALIHEHNSD